MKLSVRLLTLAEFINNPHAIICDIGTDHALLAIYLVNQQKVKAVYASDILPEPLEQGQKNINRYCQYPQAIHLLLSDGLKQLPTNIVFEYVIIAGLGSNNIIKILQDEKNFIISKYLFCPTDDACLLRQWVQKNNYFIQEEKIICENNIYYEVLLINKKNGHKVKNELDIFFGPILRQENNSVFQKKWQLQQQYYQQLLTQIPKNHLNYQKFFSKLKLINEVLKNAS